MDLGGGGGRTLVCWGDPCVDWWWGGDPGVLGRRTLLCGFLVVQSLSVVLESPGNSPCCRPRCG